MKLSARLEALLSLVGDVQVLADIGTDHALLPAHAVLRGRCQTAYAVDLRDEPLRVAARTLRALGVSNDQVRLLRGDGLKALSEFEVDAAVMAGLSGRTMLSWCQMAPEVVRRISRLVVQPNGHLTSVRAWAYAEGLWLLDENVCREGARFFVSCAFGPGTGPDPAYRDSELSTEESLVLGPWLVRRRDRLAAEMFREERSRLRGLLGTGRTEHHAQLSIVEAGCAVMVDL